MILKKQVKQKTNIESNQEYEENEENTEENPKDGPSTDNLNEMIQGGGTVLCFILTGRMNRVELTHHF